MLIMNTPPQVQKENCPPWKDWEDDGGFDDEESLMGVTGSKRSAIFQEKPWYYEKKRGNVRQPITFGIQISFL